MSTWAGLEGQPSGTKTAVAEELQRLIDSGKTSITVLVLGRNGMGKSATVNSIIGERARPTSPVQVGSLQAAEVRRRYQGLELCVVDTPGLVEGGDVNQGALDNILQFLAGREIDVLVYVDRLDAYATDLTDRMVVKAITKTFGAEVWASSLVVLTHAQLTPSDGRSYEEFVRNRVAAVEGLVGKQGGITGAQDVPVFKVENSVGRCRTNAAGDRILPDGSVWLPALFKGIVDAALSPAPKVEVTERLMGRPNANHQFKVFIPLLLLAQAFLVFFPLKGSIEQDKKDEYKNRPKWEVDAEEHRRKRSLKS